MNRRLASSVALCALSLALAACDQPSPSPAPNKAANADVNAAAASAQNSGDDINKRLEGMINARAIRGSELSITPSGGILASMKPGGTDERSLTFLNKGDEDMVLNGVAAANAQSGIVLTGCETGTKIPKGGTCILTVAYRDQTGNPLDSAILVTTNSKITPIASIEYSVRITKPDVAVVDTPPEPVRPPPPPPKPPGKVYSKAQLDAINAARGARGQGGLHSIAPNGRVVTTNPLRPEVVLKDHDKRYDPENIPWTEASLPVDRGRILTADRVIKAVLETPITNVMCNQVVAVVESHVYSPDNINVLIPRGTRVIGRCQAFADERVNIQWERMITPTGVNIRFINQLADTSDASGRGGVPGRIEQKFFDRFVLPILATSLDMIGTAARAMMGNAQTSTVDALTGTQSQTKSPMDVAIDQYNDKVVPQGKKYIDEIADVRKVIVVAGGTRLDIVPQEDIYFKGPYEVVRLADVEYDVQRNVRGPVVQETAPPPYSLNPTMGRNAGANGLNIGGQGYSLDPKDTGGAEDPNKALYAPPPMPNAPGVRQQTQQQQQQQQRQQTTGNAMNAFGPQQNTGSGQQGGPQNNTGYPAPAGRRTGTGGAGSGTGGAGAGTGTNGAGGSGYSTGNGGY